MATLHDMLCIEYAFILPAVHEICFCDVLLICRTLCLNEVHFVDSKYLHGWSVVVTQAAVFEVHCFLLLAIVVHHVLLGKLCLNLSPS